MTVPARFLTTKANVLAIAPDLADVINGRPQTTRCFILELTDNTITVAGREYIYAVQPEDTTAEIIAGLGALIEADEDPIVEVPNVQDEYLDLRGVLTSPFEVTLPAVSQTIVEASPDTLWELFALDVSDTVWGNRPPPPPPPPPPATTDPFLCMALPPQGTFSGEIERSQRYLMAHLLKVNEMIAEQGSLSSESVGSVSVSYVDPLSDNGLSMTRYGLQYKQLRNKHQRIRFT